MDAKSPNSTGKLFLSSSSIASTSVPTIAAFPCKNSLGWLLLWAMRLSESGQLGEEVCIRLPCSTACQLANAGLDNRVTTAKRDNGSDMIKDFNFSGSGTSRFGIWIVRGPKTGRGDPAHNYRSKRIFWNTFCHKRFFESKIQSACWALGPSRASERRRNGCPLRHPTGSQNAPPCLPPLFDIYGLVYGQNGVPSQPRLLPHKKKTGRGSRLLTNNA
mmetsp:Transcript_11324/g.18535  ORF Transcript_11324/g.18535 Transcript_11324/m.18535 type:complete len:217 (+) Transcript_11324:1468-2118(+)